jgi:hypothetical protein
METTITPEYVKQLAAENDELHKQNTQLLKAVEILAQKPFNDCFLYLCQSPNECQTFGCRVQKKIKELKAEHEY